MSNMKKQLKSAFSFCGKSAGALLALFGGSEALRVTGAKFAADKFQKVADDMIGSSTAQAKKDTIDENYLEILCQRGEWSILNRIIIETFRDQLWAKGGEKGKRTGEDEKHAFTLAIAKMMLTASDVLTTSLKKGKGGKNQTSKAKITAEGIAVADAWLKNFLEEKEDFDSRRLYIKKFGVFQLIERKKIGKLQQSLKDGWLATGRDGFLKLAKDLPKKSKQVIITVYESGYAAATSEVIKDIGVATVEEITETVTFGTKTVLNLGKGFIVLFCLLIIIISICEQSLLGIFIGLLPIIIIISLWWQQQKNSSTEIPEIPTITVSSSNNSKVTAETTGNDDDDDDDVDIIIDINAIEIINGQALPDGQASVILIPELNEKE